MSTKNTKGTKRTRTKPRNYGKELRTVRQNLGLSQEDLAMEFGVNRSTISRFENGLIPVHADIIDGLINPYIKAASKSNSKNR